MRLPWPFRREPLVGSATLGPVTMAAPALPVGRSAWRELPVVSRTMAEPPLVAGGEPFRADLAGARLPDPILGPLGHDRTADGPSGLAVGMMTPVVARVAAAAPASPPEMSLLSLLARRLRGATVQRSLSSPGDTASVSTDPIAPAGPPRPEPRLLHPVEPARTDAVAYSLVRVAPETVATSIQRQPLDVVRPTSLAATSPEGPREIDAATTSSTTGMTGIIAMASPAAQDAGGHGPEAQAPAAALPVLERAVHTLQRTSSGSRRVRLGPPIQRLHDGTPSVPTSSTLASAGTEAIQPLTGAPRTVIQRVESPPPVVAARSSMPRLTVARLATRPPPAPKASEASPLSITPDRETPKGIDTQASVSNVLSRAASSRLQRSATSVSASPRAAPLERPRHALQRESSPPTGGTPPAPPPSGSVVGARPLRVAAAPAQAPAARRSSETVDMTAAEHSAQGTVIPDAADPAVSTHAPATLLRDREAEEQAQRLHPHASTADGDFLWLESLGPTQSGQGQVGPPGQELPAVSRQRAPTPWMPLPGTAVQRQLQTAPSATDAWSRPGDLSLAQRTVAQGGSVRSEATPVEPVKASSGSRPSTVQMMPDAAQSTQGGGARAWRKPIAVQTADAEAAPAASVPAVPVAEAASSVAATATAMSERDLEELLRKLYPKLRHHFARELLVARERAGSLADAH